MPTISTRNEPAKRIEEKSGIPLRLPPKISGASSIPGPALTNADDVANRRKSLLPQRSISLRARRDGMGQLHGQVDNNGDRKQPSDGTAAAQKSAREPTPLSSHRSNQSDLQETMKAPQVVKSVPTARARTDRGGLPARPRSPLKSQQNDTKATAPPPPVSPKKTQMPPPARPTRSASLRQPSAPRVASAGEGRGHTRHRSQVLSSNTITLSAGPVPRQLEKSGSTIAKPQQRPPFNTFQQHFSPKKEREGRPPSATESNTSRPEGNILVASRPDVAALQTEFLQLYLLYSSSMQQDADWQSTAELRLRTKYNHVARVYQGLLAEERVAQQHRNMKALYDWSVDCENPGNRLDFATQIQSLSQVVQEVADLTAVKSGRYTMVVKAFEDWLAMLEIVRESRRDLHAIEIGPEEPQFVHRMDRAWRDEVEALTSKAELCLRVLQNLAIFALDDSQTSSSALMQIARGHRDFLTQMIDELKAMREIELEAVTLEKAWVSRAADQLRTLEDQQSVQVNPRKGAWKSA